MNVWNKASTKSAKFVERMLIGDVGEGGDHLVQSKAQEVADIREDDENGISLSMITCQEKSLKVRSYSWPQSQLVVF